MATYNKFEPFVQLLMNKEMDLFGTAEVINAYLTGGAGGPNKIAGDYMWKNQRPAYANAGQWGLFKVMPVDDQRILPLMPQVPPTKRAENDGGAVSLTSTVGK